MIQALWADYPDFKRVHFNAGFNILIGEKTKTSDPKDTRNGVGKSSVVNLIRYVLGMGSLAKTKGTPIYEWTFYLSFTLKGVKYTAARSPQKPGRIQIISGNVDKWKSEGHAFDIANGIRFTDQKTWSAILGAEAFGLSSVRENYSPSFGSLNSYFMRFGKEAFINPFLHDLHQYEWDKQVNNSYLLGLDWRDGQRFQLLRDKEKAINDLGALAELKIVSNFIGARSELESERGRVLRTLTTMREQINNFQIAAQYAHIEGDADELTSQLNALSNANFSARQLLADYEETLKKEIAEPFLDIESIYAEAGAVFRGEYLREIDAVRTFHQELIRNRQEYLQNEILRLRSAVAARQSEISSLDSRRSLLLRTLEANKALEQYTMIRSRMEESEQKLAAVTSRIEALNQIESAKAQMKIEGELLHEEMVQHYNERRESLDEAAALFNDASQHLYNAPGNLLVVPARRGYRLSYEIERKGSDGIDNAAIFCYDLAIAQSWARKSGINCLIHDSTLFDPIEERQVAHALELALDRSRDLGFQYICALNTDRIPKDIFRDVVDLERHIVLKLTDSTESGGLYGTRF